jgi:hypothetical protein
MATTSTLVLGLDPVTIAGYDPAPVLEALDRGRRRFDELGISHTMCLVPLDDSAEPTIVEHLRREPYECVVIGGGIRKEEELLEFFEVVINLVRRHAPQAAIAFNTTPVDGADAAARWVTARR